MKIIENTPFEKRAALILAAVFIAGAAVFIAGFIFGRVWGWLG